MPRQDSHCSAPPLQTWAGSLHHIALLTLEVGEQELPLLHSMESLNSALGGIFLTGCGMCLPWSRITRDDATPVG